MRGERITGLVEGAQRRDEPIQKQLHVDRVIGGDDRKGERGFGSLPHPY